ncbi:hypothetical protein [Streptomyces umbrinus]|uniref:hypothetical protein n=1 Tax=Streptomyces umbrinus TaxID=67370 RepID=UPI003C307331
MTIMTDAPAGTSRPPLPKRPVPHKRTPDRPSPSGPRPHPRSVLDAQIGPRLPGAIYQNSTGAFEVLALVTDPQKAAQLLHSYSARWAVIVRDVLRADSEPYATGAVWTNEDRLVREAKPAYAPAA